MTGHTEDKCWPKYGKPDWVKQSSNVSSIPTTSNVAPTATPLAPPAAATVTFSHEDFEHLLKIAHSDPPMPSASLANAGISVNESIPFN